jgi:hypothetical protein
MLFLCRNRALVAATTQDDTYDWPEALRYDGDGVLKKPKG